MQNKSKVKLICNSFYLVKTFRENPREQLWDKCPQRFYKTHYDYQNFYALANGVYLIAVTKQTPLRNRKSPITDPITVMGVTHTVGHEFLSLIFMKLEYND